MSEALRSTPTLTSDPVGEGEPEPNPGLLPSLGRLVRGLSALFWGLPVAMVICVQTAKADWLRPLGIVAPFLVTSVLFYGLLLLGTFQPQERVWAAALDRAKVLALMNIGLSPFLCWWNRMPWHPFYNMMVHLMFFSGLLFLFTLNPVLQRLAAMLPDETLRVETRLFTNINRGLLIAGITLLFGYFLLTRATRLPHLIVDFLVVWERVGQWVMLFLILLPIAMTMALMWKTKEVILSSVFGQDQ
ncbi:MAG TPA: hypothetical protein VK615_02075 [Candidatus Binatia bacterium]|nr:hypothetical protein [Candidatus Binatia bacterium]